MSATAVAATPARVARDALALRARGRRAHGASLGQRLESLYTAALAVVVLGSMAVSGTSDVLSGGSCADDGRCLAATGRPALGLAVALVGLGLGVRAAALLGPVGTSRAEAAWLLSTPADRRTLLLPALVRALAAAAATGGLLGWLVLESAVPDGAGASRVAAAVVSGAGVLVAAVAAVVAGQGRSRSGRLVTAVAGTLLVLGAASAVAALRAVDPLGGRSAGWAGDPGAWALTGAAVLLAVAGTALALRRLAAVPLRELRAAGDVQAGVHSSAVTLDTRLAGGALDARRHVRGRRRSRRGRGTGLGALVLRDLDRASRRPAVVLVAAGLLLVPALALALAGPLLAVVVAVLLAVTIARSAAGGLRAVSGSAGLLRAFPFTTAQVRSALLVAPLLLVLAWSTAATAVLGLVPQAAPALALAGLAGAARAVAATGSGTGPVVMTSAGPVPLGLLAQVVRGPDVALVAAVPLMLGAGPALAVAVPLVVLTLVVSIVGRRG